MNKEVPVANRVIQRRQFKKNNDIILNKIMRMKFSNISALNSSPNSQKHRPHPHPIQYNKLVSVSDQKHTVKTVLKHENMRAENKKIYDRLVSQKSTVSAKLFASQRQKNVQFLKRIGRYPYTRVQSLKLEPITDQQNTNRAIRLNTMGDFQQTERINIRLTQYSLSKNRSIITSFQQQKKEHLIVLYSKVVKLAKNWYTVKFLRFKSHYQIILQNYPETKYQYFLKLQEKIGTAMLSQNDYDYEAIYTNFIKFTSQYVCFSFELTQPEKKKHFYRFQRRNPNQLEEDQPLPHQEPRQIKKLSSIKQYRKTMFAVENQQLQKQKKENQHRYNRLKTHLQETENPLRKLQTVSSLDIRISGQGF